MFLGALLLNIATRMSDDDEIPPAAEMVSALGLIITAADDLATTGKER